MSQDCQHPPILIADHFLIDFRRSRERRRCDDDPIWHPTFHDAGLQPCQDIFRRQCSASVGLDQYDRRLLPFLMEHARNRAKELGTCVPTR